MVCVMGEALGHMLELVRQQQVGGWVCKPLHTLALQASEPPDPWRCTGPALCKLPSHCCQPPSHPRPAQVNLPGHICATVVTTLVLEGWSYELDPRHSTLSEVRAVCGWADVLAGGGQLAVALVPGRGLM